MIRNYAVYEMTDKERALFFGAGYLASMINHLGEKK